MSEPFDPFSIEDTPSKAATDDTSKTTNTTNKRRLKTSFQNDEQVHVSLEGVSHFSRGKVKPRLNVKLSYHEEVSSNSAKEMENGGGSLSRLFVTGKIMAQVESTDANTNAPFRLNLSGPMIPVTKIQCQSPTCLPLTPLNDQHKSDHTKSYKITLPKSLQPQEIMTYSMDNVETQNMPILLQTKCTIHNPTIRIGIQIRSNLSNLGDLHDFCIVLSIPSGVQGHTVQITRGNGEYDEMKGLVLWKIGHLGHGKSHLVSVEGTLTEDLLDKMEAGGEGRIDFPVLVRCSSGLDQISDLVLSVGSLEECPVRLGVQIVKSFRLIHRVCKEGV